MYKGQHPVYSFPEKLGLVLLIFLACEALVFSPSLYAGESDDVERIAVMHEEGDAAMLSHLGEIFIKKYPRSERLPEVLYLMADSELESDDKLKKLRKLVSEFGNTEFAMKARLDAGEIYFLKGDYDTCGEMLQPLHGEFIDPEFRSRALLVSARASLSAGNFEKASGFFKQLESLGDEKSRIEASIGLGDVKLYSGDCTAAIDIYEGIDREDLEPEDVARLLLGMGKCHGILGREKEKNTFFSEIIKNYPGTGAALVAEEELKSSRKYRVPEKEGLFYLQSGVFDSHEGAAEHADKLNAAGLEPLIIEGEIFKVVLGPYSDDLEAQISGENIKTEHGFDTFVLQY